MSSNVTPNLKNKSKIHNLQIPKAEDSGCFIPTLNKTGYMTTQLDSFSQEFVEYASKDKRRLVLVVGAAYGIATLAALSRGANLICNNIETRHLHLL